MNELERIKAQHKINNQSHTIILPQAFLDKFPDMKVEKAQTLFDKYLTVIAGVVVHQIPYMNDNQIQMSLHAMINKCATFNYKTVRYWVWNEFKDIYPFVSVIEVGDNLKGRKSIVEINDTAVKKLLNYTNTETLIQELFKDIPADNDPEFIPVDMENLQNYIDNCDYDLAQNSAGKNDKWHKKVRRNQSQAQLIYRIAKSMDGQFPQYEKPSVYGRTYYHGLSIQTMSKEVRSAALGEHYQYDMNAAVYGIKLGIINEIERERRNTPNDRHIENNLFGQWTYTKEYLQEKDAIRKRLVMDCLLDTKGNFKAKLTIIKKALTAIGFGAKTDIQFLYGEKLPAIKAIIWNNDDRERFLNDRFVKNFFKEQKEITEYVIEHLKKTGEFDQIKQLIKAEKGPQRLTSDHILAFMFQQFEKGIMDNIVAIIQSAGVPVVARIHDALVTMTELPAGLYQTVADKLRETHSLLSMDVEHINKWTPLDKRKSNDRAKEFEEDHKRRIQQEEYNAHYGVAPKKVNELMAAMAPTPVTTDDDMTQFRQNELRKKLIDILQGQPETVRYLIDANKAGMMSEQQAIEQAEEFMGAVSDGFN